MFVIQTYLRPVAGSMRRNMLEKRLDRNSTILTAFFLRGARFTKLLKCIDEAGAPPGAITR